jgi:archaellum component FlaF (FlaF/FlaG flagellin family)
MCAVVFSVLYRRVSKSHKNLSASYEARIKQLEDQLDEMIANIKA